MDSAHLPNEESPMSKMMIVVALVVAGGCAATQLHRQLVPGQDYKIVTIADDAQSRFEISLSSLSTSDYCFQSQDWPLDSGMWRGESGLFKLMYETGSLEPPDDNAGICMGPGCRRRLKKGSTITSHLNYAVFGDPEKIISLRGKTLVYTPHISQCP
jgi:hypothetical protein